jgi:hypothetical protein
MPINYDLLKTVDDFNPFTTELFVSIELSDNGIVRVELRNDTIVKVTWNPGNPKYDERGSFESVDGNYRWWNNGKSLTSSDYDLIRY